MTLYNGTNPFIDHGVVWNGTAGSIRTGDTATGIANKPLLNFLFDTLNANYDDVTKTKDNSTTALSHTEIVEVLSYLGQIKGSTILVGGVDANGKWLPNVSASQLVKLTPPPPDGGNWRFSLATNEWKSIHCVSSDGSYIGNQPDGSYASIVPSSPPEAPNGEIWRWNGTEWADSRSAAAILEAAKTAAILSVNTAAEAKRMTYTTPGSGQAMTYQKKLVEAQIIMVDAASQAAADAMNNADLKANYPMIWASIPKSGATALAVAQLVINTELQWGQIGGVIEKKRNTALLAIEQATTLAAVQEAATVDWTIA